MSPISGLPGTEITIRGDFDPGGGHDVRFNGVAVAMSGVTESTLTLIVPGGARSGRISVDGVSFPTPFAVLREIAGRFVPPARLGLNGYSVGTAEDVRELEADGTFSALVEVGMPSSVMVFRGDDESAFLARVTSGETSIIVDAGSTAEALILANPLLEARDDQFIADYRVAMRGLSEFAALVEIIESSSSGDYLDDARVDALLVSLIPQVAGTRPQVAPQRGAPFKGSEFVRSIGVELRELNPDPEVTVNPIFRHEVSLESFVKDDPEDIDQLIFSYGRARDTRLDWALSLRQMQPWQFPNGFADLAALEGNDPDTAPIPSTSGLADAGWVRAKLFSEEFDLLKRATDGMRDLLVGSLEREANLDGTEDFTIPNEPDALYLITGTSGNLWYGTDWLFLGANNQEASIDKVGAGSQWTLSAAANLVAAAVDVANVFVNVKDVAGIAGDYIKTVTLSVVKTISAYRNGSDAFTQAAAYELVKNLAADLSRTFAAEQAKRIPEKATKFVAMAGSTAKFVFKTVDILGKLSSTGQALERSGTLFSPGTLAMERAILVVGDPFAPKITSVTPLTGRTGSELVITGVNLAARGEAVPLVSFCQFPTSIPPGSEPEPDSSVVPLVAEVVEATSTRLTIRVPSGFAERFGNSGAHVCVTKATNADADGNSYHLGDDGKFTLIPPPEVDGLEPVPEANGGAVTLIGKHFVGRHPEVTVDGRVIETSVVDDTRLLLTLPFLQPGVDHSLVVSYESEDSAAFVFQVTRPAHIASEPSAGARITVNAFDMSNVADDKISVKEAFLIATGGLGRGLGDDEARWVVNAAQAGAEGRDVINFGLSTRDQVVIMAEPLPPIGTADSVNFDGLILDGSSAPVGSDGFVLDNSANVIIRDVTLRGWKGDGIRVTNGSSGNVFRGIAIESVGETGIFIDNDSNFNAFTDTVVHGAGRDGLSVSGGCHHNMFSTLSVTDVGRHGVFFSDGVSRHTMDTLTVSGAVGDGVVLRDDAIGNLFSGVTKISGIGGTGLVLSGDGVRNNLGYGAGDEATHWSNTVIECGGYGVLIDNGASFNKVAMRSLVKCAAGGALVLGDGTKGNTIGRNPVSDPTLLNAPVLVFTEVTDNGSLGNGGKGIHLADGAQNNTLVGLSVSGSGGDAFLIEGETCRFNSLLTIRTGAVDDPEVEREDDVISNPNRGSGIRIRDGANNNEMAARIPVFIGTFGGGNFSYKWRNRIANDLEHGIVFEAGAHSNVIFDTDIGGTAVDDGEGAIGKSGLVIQTGASDNRIGGNNDNERIYINACAEAAVIIDGPETSGNVLSNMEIGSRAHRGVDSPLLDSRPNALGVVLRNGTHGNSIGIPGPLENAATLFPGFPPPNETMFLQGTAGAAITLDGCGRLDSPNLVQACRILSVQTGVRITGGAHSNVIGSREGSNGNSISVVATGVAGIHIDGNVIGESERLDRRNRFHGNSVSVEELPDPGVDLFTAAPQGVGLLISNGASGNIFGETVATGNSIGGVLIDNASGNVVRSSIISSFGNSLGHRAGVIVRNSSNNLIGALGPGEGNQIGNLFFGPRPPLAAGSKSAGIALVQGGNHTVRGNLIQTQPGHGVLIENSASNLIGGEPADANRVVINARSGVAILGQSSQNNAILSNVIGTDFSNTRLGNKEYGVHLDDAAGGNRVGGRMDPNVGAATFRRRGVASAGPMGNTIAFNELEGVAVVGPDTKGNPILFNSIYGNLAGGIALIAGGNSGLQVDASGTFGRGVATGTITNLNMVPPGSIIQLFGDSATQGELYLGQTEVLPGGSFLAQHLPSHPFRHVRFTATTPDAAGYGDTSPFHQLQPLAEPSFRIMRPHQDEPMARTVAFTDTMLPVMSLRLSAAASPIQLTALTLQAGGSFDEVGQLAALRLFRDADGDGRFSARDDEVAEPQAFQADNGEATFSLASVIVSPGQPLDLWVVYQARGEIPQGATISMEVVSAESVEASFLYPPGEAVPMNEFPVASDNLTLGVAVTGLTFTVWQGQFFPGNNAASVAGPHADPDGDGVANLLEFVFGTDPTKNASARLPSPLRDGRRGLAFLTAPGREGAVVTIEASLDMEIWTPAVGESRQIGDLIEFQASEASGGLFLRVKAELE